MFYRLENCSCRLSKSYKQCCKNVIWQIRTNGDTDLRKIVKINVLKLRFDGLERSEDILQASLEKQCSKIIHNLIQEAQGKSGKRSIFVLVTADYLESFAFDKINCRQFSHVRSKIWVMYTPAGVSLPTFTVSGTCIHVYESRQSTIINTQSAIIVT